MVECGKADARRLAEFGDRVSTLSDDDLENELLRGVQPILDSRGLEIVPKRVGGV
jgi:hypothetical protein